MVNFLNNKKYFIILILLAVLILPSFVLASWWNPFSWNIWQKIAEIFYKPQVVQVEQEKKADEIKVDEIKDWKTYTNTEYGFEIKYPNYFENDKDLPAEYVNSTAWLFGRQNGYQLTIRGLNIEEKGLSFADYGIDYDNKKYTCIGSCIGEILKLPALDGRKSVTTISVSRTLGTSDIYLETLIQKDSKTMIEILIHSDQTSRQDIIDLNQKMILTFKFIK